MRTYLSILILFSFFTANNRVDEVGELPTYPTLNGLVIDVLVTEK